MFDGSALPPQENLANAATLLAECAELEVILELEIGVVSPAPWGRPSGRTTFP